MPPVSYSKERISSRIEVVIRNKKAKKTTECRWYPKPNVTSASTNTMNLLQSLTQSVNLLQEEVSTITRHLGQFTTPPTNIKLSHVPRSSQTNSSIITNSANISTSRIQLHDSLLSMSYSSSMLIQPPVWNNANSVNFLNNNALFVYSHNFMPSPLRVLSSSYNVKSAGEKQHVGVANCTKSRFIK